MHDLVSILAFPLDFLDMSVAQFKIISLTAWYRASLVVNFWNTVLATYLRYFLTSKHNGNEGLIDNWTELRYASKTATAQRI
jgi:hypothetical protein